MRDSKWRNFIWAMIYSSKHNFCFVAVPKTGTSSISKYLSSLDGIERNIFPDAEGGATVINEHDPVRKIVKVMGEEKWESLFTFGGVRNPWSRVVSAYHFYRHGRAAKRVMAFRQPHPVAIANVLLAKLLPFSLWVRLYRTRTYLSYLVDERGQLAVDAVLKQESLNQDFSKVCEMIGVPPVDLPVENKSAHADYREYFNDSTRAVVARYFKEDIEAFGYEF